MDTSTPRPLELPVVLFVFAGVYLKVHLDFINLGKLLLQGLKQAFEAASTSITIMLSST